MRRMVFIGSWLVLMLLTCGCIQASGDQTVPPSPVTPGIGKVYAGTGVRIALAVST